MLLFVTSDFKMRWSRLHALAALAAPVAAKHGLADKLAVETVASGVQQRSPEPTAAPLVAKTLNKRAGTNTCGYIEGSGLRPIVCNASGSECLQDNNARAVGCCWTQPNDCLIYTACLPQASSNEYASADQERTQYCSASTAPYCVVNSYMDPTMSGYTMQICGAAPATNSFFIQAFTDLSVTGSSSSARGFSASTTPRPSTTSESDPETTEDTATNASAGDASSTSTSTQSQTATSAPASSGTPIGPIVGGVVGGVAALALVGFLAWFLIRRRRNAAEPEHHQQQSQPLTPQAFQQQQFGPGGPGGPHPPVMMMQQQQHPQSPPLYDPRMSTYKPSPDSYAGPVAAGGPSSVSPTGSPPIPDQHNSYYGNQGSQSPPIGQQGYPPQQYQQPYQQPYQEPYQQPYQQQQQAYQPYQPQQQQQYGAVPPQGQPPHRNNAVELPSTRPDGELRELA